jgi:peptide/nickel transport system substrate-binding protein
MKPGRDARHRRPVTLRLGGPGDIDRLDPTVAPPHTWQVVRLFSRQLLSYESRADLRDWRCVPPVADVAVDVPSTYNAGLGASHRSYIVHLRPGVLWDTEPPRSVTAADFIRGFKRLANPLVRAPALTYFRSSVRGMAEFCDGFTSAVSAENATAEQLASYQNSHDIAGVFALDDESLVIELVRACPDFLQMLALPGASAAPIEYDAYLPGSVDLCRHLRSNGPYRITQYVPGRALRLEQHPAWRNDCDPVRRRQVDAIEITVDHDTTGLVERIDAGLIDLPWDLRRPASTGMLEPAPATDALVGWDLDPYLVFNLEVGAPALRDQRVRRAVATSVDKSSIWTAFRALHDGIATRIAASIVPPHNDAHEDRAVQPTEVGGDPDLARSLLRQAGHEHGLVLTAVFERGGFDAQTALLCADALDLAGIELRLVGLEPSAFARLVSESPDAMSPRWDVMVRAHSPDWHYQNGRVFLQPMFETAGTANVGGFSDPIADELIDRALEAAVDAQARAAAAWHAVERRVLEQHIVVPLLFRAPPAPPRHSARVRDAFAMPALRNAYDISALWLVDDESVNDFRPYDSAQAQGVCEWNNIS